MLRHCKLSVHTCSSDAKNVKSVRLKNLSTFIPSPSMMSPTLMPVTFGPIVFFQRWIGPVLTVVVLARIHRDLNHCLGYIRTKQSHSSLQPTSWCLPIFEAVIQGHDIFISVTHTGFLRSSGCQVRRSKQRLDCSKMPDNNYSFDSPILCNALQIWKKRWPRSSHKGSIKIPHTR